MIDLLDIQLVIAVVDLASDDRTDIEEMRCCMHALANLSHHKVNIPRIAESLIRISDALIVFVKTMDMVTS